jgi:thiamine kinase-like enzyme
MHSLRQRDYPGWALPTAWFHWFDFEPYLSELRDFVTQYGAWLATTGPEGARLRDRLARLVDRCNQVLTTMDVDVGQDGLPLCLCHVDQNLANAVWGPDGRLRWIDWEFAGWGDPALDLAELRWHAALEGLGPAQQTWLRASYRRSDDDPSFEARLLAWDHLITTRWPFLVLRVLWSLSNGPDRLRLSQPQHDPVEVRARLHRFVERAECFLFGRSF